MTTKPTNSLIGKIAAGVLTAVLISGGGAVISGAKANAVQDRRLDDHDKAFEQMAELSKKLDVTNQNVAELNGRLKERNESRE